jgi:ABC-type nitrate/sulfonate/bicarbonate transport system substrate-binding protein
VAAISPPIFLVGRDKYKMNILDSSVDKFSSIQNGLAVNVKTLEAKPDLVKKILRARAKANRYFHENERGTSEILAQLWKTDLATAVETYRLSKPAFTHNGIPSDEGIKEYLALDAQILKLPEPMHPSKVFDFTLQREVNREMGSR